jgi:hypothetical protein
MDDVYDEGSCALRFDQQLGASTGELLILLRKHGSTLRRLHIE